MSTVRYSDARTLTWEQAHIGVHRGAHWGIYGAWVVATRRPAMHMSGTLHTGNDTAQGHVAHTYRSLAAPPTLQHSPAMPRQPPPQKRQRCTTVYTIYVPFSSKHYKPWLCQPFNHGVQVYFAIYPVLPSSSVLVATPGSGRLSAHRFVG